MEFESIGAIDITTFVGLMALTTLGIGTLKALRPSWVTGRESLIALIAPVAIGSLVKLAGWGFVELAWWPEFILGAVGVSVGSGLVHDSVSNPIKALLKFLPSLLKAVKEEPTKTTAKKK